MKGDRVTAEQFREMQARGLTTPAALGPRRSKYNNVPTEVDGIVFDSGREAARYVALRKDEERGRIRGLRLQYVFPLVIDGVYITTYTSDFQYEERSGDKWVQITEDSKGKRTEAYMIRKRLMRAIHGITIRET